MKKILCTILLAFLSITLWATDCHEVFRWEEFPNYRTLFAMRTDLLPLPRYVWIPMTDVLSMDLDLMPGRNFQLFQAGDFQIGENTQLHIRMKENYRTVTRDGIDIRQGKGEAAIGITHQVGDAFAFGINFDAPVDIPDTPFQN